MYIILPPLKYKLSACHKKIYSQLNKHKNGVPPKNNGLKDNFGMLAKSVSIARKITLLESWNDYQPKKIYGEQSKFQELHLEASNQY